MGEMKQNTGRPRIKKNNRSCPQKEFSTYLQINVRLLLLLHIVEDFIDCRVSCNIKFSSPAECNLSATVRDPVTSHVKLGFNCLDIYSCTLVKTPKIAWHFDALSENRPFSVTRTVQGSFFSAKSYLGSYLSFALLKSEIYFQLFPLWLFEKHKNPNLARRNPGLSRISTKIHVSGRN